MVAQKMISSCPSLIHWWRIQKQLEESKTTKKVEDLFRKEREAENDDTANKLGRSARWHRAVTSKVLEECDRPTAKVNDCDRVNAPSKIGNAFSRRSQQHSVLVKILKRIS